MAILLASGVTLSLTTGAKSAEQVVGRFQNVGPGRIQLMGRGSVAAATGIRATLNVGGVPLMDDQLVPYAGATGTVTTDHMIIDQRVAGGWVSLTFRNDSAGTLTVDYTLLFTPD